MITGFKPRKGETNQYILENRKILYFIVITYLIYIKHILFINSYNVIDICFSAFLNNLNKI